MAQLQAAVDQIIATRRLVMRVDMEIAAMRVKVRLARQTSAAPPPHLPRRFAIHSAPACGM